MNISNYRYLPNLFFDNKRTFRSINPDYIGYEDCLIDIIDNIRNAKGYYPLSKYQKTCQKCGRLIANGTECVDCKQKYIVRCLRVFTERLTIIEKEVAGKKLAKARKQKRIEKEIEIITKARKQRNKKIAKINKSEMTYHLVRKKRKYVIRNGVFGYAGTKCKVPECNNPVHGNKRLGYCSKHYQLFRKRIVNFLNKEENHVRPKLKSRPGIV